MNTEALKAEAVTSEPVTGAGFDPAFIPGITGPASPSEPKSSPEPEADEPLAEKTAVDEAGALDAPTEDAPPSPDDASADAPSDGPSDAPSDGPVFEAADRRARIVADHKGVRLSLDEESCEFGWDEIAAVESETPRFGKRYTITVHTPERRWYPIEIEAPSRSRFKEWDEQLDAVLDAYFEDGD
ncbi:hypothetical protein HZZ00_32080 [Streptomyces sp. NEAU-sy36]|nr:hypothetical protein HZZ00_32080 [Streptomyces sp. NEAU-sy36]